MGIKLYFLQASRCIRTAWQLEELGLEYEVEFSPRENKIAPAAFKQKAGDLGKFPTLVDDGVSIYESGNIAAYLEEKYDAQHRLLAAELDKKYETLRWTHACEGTYMLHALPVLYVTWFGGGHAEAQETIIGGMARNINADLDLLEKELDRYPGRFLMGERLTVADITMHFTVSLVLARQLGTNGRSWPRVETWVRDCESTEGYKKAVEKTGYDLSQSG